MLPIVTLWRSMTLAPSTVPVFTTSPWPWRIRRPGPATTWAGSSTPSIHSTSTRYATRTGTAASRAPMDRWPAARAAAARRYDVTRRSPFGSWRLAATSARSASRHGPGGVGAGEVTDLVYPTGGRSEDPG